ncbi:hypothetical protein CPB86DRAFT_805070 [Serendipita vermifera]|nr:hypothetical protein CPB86DRAFT_805070 [Serendipita vermifera]
MSFFGFETGLPKGHDRSAHAASAEEDVAVYTWGEVSYDTLGDALEETGDDFNDETFGSGPVGKDFDFSGNSATIFSGEPHTQFDGRPTSKSNVILDAIHKSEQASHPWQGKDSGVKAPKNVAPSSIPEQTLGYQNGSQLSSTSVFSRIDSVGSSTAKSYPSSQATVISNEPQTASVFSVINQGVPYSADEAQQRLAQQMELERLQREREYLMQQRMQEEERFHLERGQMLHTGPQPQQDPLWLIRQAMMEQREAHEGGMRSEQLSNMPDVSPAVQNRHPMPAPHSGQTPAMGHALPNQQYNILQDLLLQQQHQQQNQKQRQILEQQLLNQQLLEATQQEAVIADAHQRIQQAEMLDIKHRRKVAKIQAMSRYNDLMTQSDKDFITRVQVAQLVTSDPYADDFYAQVFASIREQRLTANGGAPGNVPGHGRTQSRAPHRRENAIQRMQAQVERLVNNMKNRELSKESGATNTTLQNVLGKTSGRSYKAAPRQLLQVAIASPESQKAHPHPVKDHDLDKIAGNPYNHGQLPAPFTRAESLLIIEKLFSIILDVEQLRRNRPVTEDASVISEWNTRLQELLDDIWKGLRIWGPLYETDPHPFIALIAPLKGKKFIGRLGRDLTEDQKITALSVIVNRIEQLDVIRNASILDSIEDTPQRRQVERQAYAFQEYVINQGLQLPHSNRSLRTYNALIEMMIEDASAFARVVNTRPGLSLLEHFFAEASLLKNGVQGPEGEMITVPTEDLIKWGNLYDRLFDLLLPLWNIMFPSTRILLAFVPDSIESVQASLIADGFDQHVWRFLAGFALEGTPEQHSKLVTQLRAKVMGTLRMAVRLEEGKAKSRKIRNVDLFLNSLGLSSSQIPLQ